MLNSAGLVGGRIFVKFLIFLEITFLAFFMQMRAQKHAKLAG